MLISQSSETANYNAWDEDIAMVKVKDFKVQKILVAHSQQLSITNPLQIFFGKGSMSEYRR